MHTFHGSLVALITPFKEGKLDEKALERLVEWHIANGTDGIVPAGTTGESPTLSAEEHARVIDIVCKVANKRIPVMAGAGSNNPVEAVHYSQEAERSGADGLLHVAGYYNRPNQDGLYAHFKFVHDQTSLPIFVYNIPGRAVVNVLPATLAKLAELQGQGTFTAALPDDAGLDVGDSVTAYDSTTGIGVEAQVTKVICKVSLGEAVTSYETGEPQWPEDEE